MAAPAHNTRKPFKTHATETVEQQEILEEGARAVGYGAVKPNWQKYEEGTDKGAQSVRELRQTGRQG